MLRTLVVATVALLSFLGTLPGSRPAAAALIERQDVPGQFRRYEELHFSGGSTTGETGWYDFYFGVGAQRFKLNTVARLFAEDPFIVSDGVRAKVILFSQKDPSGRQALETRHEYVDEQLNLIGFGTTVIRSTDNPPYRLRIKVLEAPEDGYEFDWNGRILHQAYRRFNIADHGFDATIIDRNGVAVTPAPAGVLLLAPGLLGLGWLARRRSVRAEGP